MKHEPLLLKSNTQSSCDGIPLKGEEIIGRYGQEKTSTHRFQSGFRWYNIDRDTSLARGFFGSALRHSLPDASIAYIPDIKPEKSVYLCPPVIVNR